MQFNEFANRLLSRIRTLKTLESSLSSQETIDEDQSVIDELEQLLAQYAHDENEINDEALLQPFCNFLANRYQRIALTGLSYHANPNTRANQACKLLANQIVVAANQVHYKSRHVDDLLMPKVVWQLNGLAEIYLDLVNRLLAQPQFQQDLFIELESYYALLRLKSVLVQLRNDDSAITLESIKPILGLFSARWRAIEDTNADYIYNKSSVANDLYQDLAVRIFRILQAGRYNIHGLSVDRLLRPVIHAQKINPDNAIKKTVFSLLKREEKLSDHLRQPVTDRLKSLAICEADFARLVLNEIKDISDDDFEHAPFEVNIESQQTVHQLTELCHQYTDSHKPVNRTMLSVFINFLSSRWKGIAGTPAAYSSNVHTAANQACELLADVISLTAYHIGHLNREQTNLLMRNKVEVLSVEAAQQKLHKTVIEQVQNRDQLVASLTLLDHKYWDDYLKLFEPAQLIKLITQKSSQFGALLEWNEPCHYTERQYKALMYAVLGVYARIRAETTSAHTSYFGAFSSYIVSVPSRDDKLAAVNEIKQLLKSDLSLAGIVAIINDESSPCYQQHHSSLDNGALKKLVMLLTVAVEACRHDDVLEQNKGVVNLTV